MEKVSGKTFEQWIGELGVLFRENNADLGEPVSWMPVWRDGVTPEDAYKRAIAEQFGAVFNSSPSDIDLLDLLIDSAPEKPLYLTLPNGQEERKTAYSSIEMLSESAFKAGAKNVHICIVDMSN